MNHKPAWMSLIVLFFGITAPAQEQPPSNSVHRLSRHVINSGDDADPESAALNLRLRQVSVAELGVAEGIVSNRAFCLSLGLLDAEPQCGQECDRIWYHRAKYKPRHDRIISKVFLRLGSGAGWTVFFECTAPDRSSQIEPGITTGHGKARAKFARFDGSGTYVSAIVRIQNPRGEDVCAGYFDPKEVEVP